MQNDATFPDDIAALKALLMVQDAALVQSQNRVAQLTSALSSRELQIEALQLHILALHRRQFGRKSEQLDGQIEQLELKLEELQTDEGQALAPDIAEAPNDALQHHVMAGAKLHADDTPIPVLSPGRGKTTTARLWVYVRDDRP